MSSDSSPTLSARQITWHSDHLRLLLSVVTLPSLLAITATHLAARQLTKIDQNSVEVLRGKRLPILPFPADI